MAERDPRLPQEAHPREVLRARGLHASRRLGQNFLVGAGALDRIVEAAQVRADEAVLEIGAGLGYLTARLAARARRVVAVEIDGGLHKVAAENLSAFDNVELLCCDFLAAKHEISPAVTDAAKRACAQTARPFRVVSNLPYSISSPAIVNLLEWEVEVGEMCMMLQKEVADRIAARPGTPEYGTLTVFVVHWAEVERLFSLPPGAFWPAPKVDSTLLRITRRPGLTADADYARFAEVVRVVFMHRRKTLGRVLRERWGLEAAQRALDALGVEANTRAETLSLDQFRRLADALA